MMASASLEINLAIPGRLNYVDSIVPKPSPECDEKSSTLYKHGDIICVEIDEV